MFGLQAPGGGAVVRVEMHLESPMQVIRWTRLEGSLSVPVPGACACVEEASEHSLFAGGAADYGCAGFVSEDRPRAVEKTTCSALQLVATAEQRYSSVNVCISLVQRP